MKQTSGQPDDGGHGPVNEDEINKLLLLLGCTATAASNWLPLFHTAGGDEILQAPLQSLRLVLLAAGCTFPTIFDVALCVIFTTRKMIYSNTQSFFMVTVNNSHRYKK
jgi:hypothetical protein